MKGRKPRATERERAAVAWPTNRGLVLVAVLLFADGQKGVSGDFRGGQ